jgi:hypothetical protein
LWLVQVLQSIYEKWVNYIQVYSVYDFYVSFWSFFSWHKMQLFHFFCSYKLLFYGRQYKTKKISRKKSRTNQQHFTHYGWVNMRIESFLVFVAKWGRKNRTCKSIIKINVWVPVEHCFILLYAVQKIIITNLTMHKMPPNYENMMFFMKSLHTVSSIKLKQLDKYYESLIWILF